MEIFAKRGDITVTPEFSRICNLPRRVHTPEFLEKIRAELEPHLRRPGGKMSLRPIQAAALYDIMSAGGLLAPIRVGGGKTLLSFLSALVLGAKRPLLLIPASLVEKTERERRILSEHWNIPRNIQIYSYERLSRANSAAFLHLNRPDLIITDESHRLKNKRAGVTKRVARYMKEFPDTKFIAMSGTIMKAGLEDFGRLAKWALKDKSPVPADEQELLLWSDAMDESDSFRSMGPGALLTFADPKDIEAYGEKRAARIGFRKRLLETPGVVASGNNEGVTCSLLIEAKDYEVSPTTDANFKILRERAETPDGWALAEAVQIWACARELSIGLHYVWDPRPPMQWLEARRAWAKFVREYLSRSRTLDTEFQVATAVYKGELPQGEGVYRAWKEIEPTFTVNSKPVWHDDSALKFCIEWGKQAKAGIIWCEHTFFARELERLSGWTYYGREGLSKHGTVIEDASGVIIASMAANSTGRNLQKWNKNLITSVQGATVLEQLIGRTHRDGQEADEVIVDIMRGCREHDEGFQKAVEAARKIQDMTGHEQKILLADLSWPANVNMKGWRYAANT